MKYLKLFEGYQTESEVAEICKKYDIENWSLNSDGLVDVNGGVILHNEHLEKLPLKFGTVTGNFNCNDNQLTSLVGAPHTVGGSFNCARNKLISLKGAPHTVGGSFDCPRNKLISLEGAPKSVGGYFDCNFNVLKTLEGAPHTVGANFRCEYNQLTSLEGSPKVTGGFYCRGNNIRSFEGLNISGDLRCQNNPLYPIWIIISPGTNKWDSEKMEFFNDLDIIRGYEIAIERFNFFLEEIGLDPVEYVEGYKNIY